MQSSATPLISHHPVTLSVVIIGRNEEQYIGRAVESALSALRFFPDLEVIFADSASTDRTIEIAQGYPIRIVRLRDHWPLCVAAGRYTGYLHSHGQYVFFQDGDSELNADWLSKAVQFLDADQSYGAVAGILEEVYTDRQGNELSRDENVFDQDLTRDVIDCKNLGGIALYRRKAMQMAGPVNPHLPTAEDHELCLRIRNAGFRVARISGTMAVKYTENRQTFQEVFRRSRTRMYDYGAVIRHARIYGGAFQFCWDAIPFVVSSIVLGLAFFLTGLIALALSQWWLIFVLGGSAGVLGIAQIVKKGGIHGAGLSSAVRCVSTYRTIVSYLQTKPKRVEDYPTDAIQVR